MSTTSYTLQHLADVSDASLERRRLSRFVMYVFDFGAPVGFRLGNATRMDRGFVHTRSSVIASLVVALLA